MIIAILAGALAIAFVAGFIGYGPLRPLCQWILNRFFPTWGGGGN